MFDWQSFLVARNIPYITEGKNVKQGNVNTHCPFCGDSDPSEHMGINLESGKWGCWRDQGHRGINPTNLVMALLGCGYKEAKTLVQDDAPSLRKSSDLLSEISKIGEQQHTQVYKFKPLELPPECQRLNLKTNKQTLQYLRKRGFDDAGITTACSLFNLHYCLIGGMAGRLVIPVYHVIKNHPEMVAYTGRTISKNEGLRYLTYPQGDVIKRTVLGQARANKGGDVLLVVEGPLDCIKFQAYAGNHVNVVALCGVAWTEHQLAEVDRLAEGHKRVCVLFDEDAISRSYQFSAMLTRHTPWVIPLPEQAADPADMSQQQIEQMVLEIRNLPTPV